MKKRVAIFIALMLSTCAIYAQKLIITEVDAAENNFFNEASIQALGKNMELNLSGNSLSVKIESEPELILTKLSERIFETERKTKNGIEKFSIKLKTTNSVITSAEFTGTIIPNGDEGKKVWWTVTAKKSDVLKLM
ncbi:MAG TPA: hypothetical protein VIM16_02010 [Mucilaginibacter sp.]|jgi:hypothetical protein